MRNETKRTAAVRNKLHSRKGESISEVLVALLVSTLGIVLLASMIASSSRLIEKSRATVQSYVTEENAIVDRGTSDLKGTVSVRTDGNSRRLTDSAATSADVYFYVNDVIAGTPVIAYRKQGN